MIGLKPAKTLKKAGGGSHRWMSGGECSAQMIFGAFLTRAGDGLVSI